MNIWRILGIDPTTDKAAITAAYRSGLSHANPEDDPEAFKALRAAYEQALAKQAAAAEKEGPQNEADRWAEQVDAVYQDIHRRRDPAAWQALLDADFCLQLANRSQARDRLLQYLTDHYFLPRAVWMLLDDFFALRQNAAELYQLFPRPFIDNVVLAGIENSELVPYSFLEGETAQQCDTYLKAYSRCMRALSGGRDEQAEAALQEMDQSGAQHPYTRLCRARLALMHQAFDAAQEHVSAVLAQIPGDIHALLLDAQLALHAEDYARAEQELRQVLDTAPHLAQARFDLAGCLHRAGQYLDAKKLYLELLRTLPFNRLIQEQLARVNEDLLPILQQRYAGCPADADNAAELAWCYHQMQQEDKADAVLAALPADRAGTADYENLAAKIKLAQGDWSAALDHLRAWEGALRQQTVPDPARLPESIRLQGYALYAQGQKEEALALLDQVTAQWPDDAETWKLKAQFALEQDQPPAALAAAQQLQQTAPADPSGPYLCGEALFRMRRLQEAYNAFDAAMERAGGKDAGCLLYQCRILILAEQWDQAQKLADQLMAAKIESPALHYCLARLASHAKRNDEALQHYKAILPACRSDDPPDFGGEVFFRLACLQYKDLEDHALLALVEEGLRLDPDSISLLDLKVDLLRACDEIPAALESCRRLCQLAPRHSSAFETLGRLLQFWQRDFAGAAQAYETQLDIRESAALHNLLGLCFQELERFDDAKAHFVKALELSPRCPAFQANLAELYLLQKQYAQAESAYQAALRLPLPRVRDRVLMRRRLSLALRRMGRWAQAVEVLQPNIQNEYQYSDCLRQAEIWAQAGQPEPAMQALRHWRTLAAPAESVYLLHAAALQRQMGREAAALRLLRRGARVSRACGAALADLYAAMGRYKPAILLLRQLARDAADDDHLLDALAKCQLWSGDSRAAAETAAQGLALLERNRSHYNKAMFYTRQASFLITSGAYEQAAAALKKAESCPFCQQCPYAVCKDAIALRVLLCEQTGQLEQAAALCQTSQLRYPDEPDFAAYGKRIRKKMGQKA